VDPLLARRVYRGSGALLALIVVGNLANLSVFSATIPGPESYLGGHRNARDHRRIRADRRHLGPRRAYRAPDCLQVIRNIARHSPLSVHNGIHQAWFHRENAQPTIEPKLSSMDEATLGFLWRQQ
jgi:hypothetical protein